MAGLLQSAKLADIEQHGYVLTPGRTWARRPAEDDDGGPFEQKMTRLVAKLEEQFAEGAKLERQIRKNLKGLGFGD